MRSLNDVMSILDWAHARGALQVKVGETVEVLFPPTPLRSETLPPPPSSPLDDPDYFLDYKPARPTSRIPEE